MNLWDIFFTTQATEPPKFDLFWYVSLFTLLALTFYTAYRYREKKVYQRFFQILQAVQLILLYGWYGVNHMPLSNIIVYISLSDLLLFMVFIKRKTIEKYKKISFLGQIWGEIFSKNFIKTLDFLGTP